jgi:hypothetical protein
MEDRVMQQERRKGTRANLEAQLMIKRLDADEEEEITIDIIDASKSGIGFTSSAELTMGAVYEANLRIWTKEVIHTFVHIIRVDKKDGRFEYGGFFVGMSEMDAARIDLYHVVERTTKEMEAGEN